MKPHIKDTLNEIEGDIATLTTLRDNLTSLYGGNNEAAATRRAPRKGGRHPARAPQPAPASNGETGVRAGSVQEKVLLAAKKLPEPFTAEAVAIAAGMDKTEAGQTLFLLKQKNLVQAVGKEGNRVSYRCA